jgi:CelD/BcsL family acetyltransferase involved in cellulose biosynthesis
VQDSQKLPALDLSVERLEGIQALEAVREDWTTVYNADAEASIYVSFPWIKAYVGATSCCLTVVTLRSHSSGSRVAFLPLVASDVRRGGIVVARELRLAGSPLADYPGMVCLPGFEIRAVEAFSNFIRNELRWDRFLISDVLDSRCASLITSLEGAGLRVDMRGMVACPYLELKPSWQQYLSEQLGPNFRKNLRKRMRQVEMLPNTRLIEATSENLELQIAVMTRLNESRYGARDTAEAVAAIYRECFAENCLYLRTLWTDDTPIAALAGFIDRPKRTLYGYSCGFDQSFAKLSPGTVLQAYTIRYALDSGLRIIDFGRGPEAYKYHFGATDRQARRWIIHRTDARGTLIQIAQRILSVARRIAAPLATRW